MAIETRSPDTKPLLAYLLLMMTFSFIEQYTYLGVVTSMPIIAALKSVLMLFCSVPQTGAALFVYSAVAAPWFGPGGKFASPSAGSASSSRKSAKSASGGGGGDNEATKKLAVVVKHLVGAEPCAEPLYVMLESSGLAEGLRFVTLAKAFSDDLVAWQETLVLPFGAAADGSELKVSVFKKQQFGSDTLLGSASMALESLSLLGADTQKVSSLDLALEGVSGTLSLDCSCCLA